MTAPLPPQTTCELARELCARCHLLCLRVRKRTLAQGAQRQARCMALVLGTMERLAHHEAGR